MACSQLLLSASPLQESAGHYLAHFQLSRGSPPALRPLIVSEGGPVRVGRGVGIVLVEAEEDVLIREMGRRSKDSVIGKTGGQAGEATPQHRERW